MKQRVLVTGANGVLAKSLSKFLEKDYSVRFLTRNATKDIQILFGELSSIFLKGSRVSSDKIREEGYSFKFIKVDQALKDLLR